MSSVPGRGRNLFVISCRCSATMICQYSILGSHLMDYSDLAKQITLVFPLRMF